MQTIELEFKHLNKLPVPKSVHEFLFIEAPDKRQLCVKATENGLISSEYIFPIAFHKKATYAHIQVTPKPETAFKVGDRVLYKNYEMVICYIHQKESSCILFNSSFTGIVEEVPLTDLTLITE